MIRVDRELSGYRLVTDGFFCFVINWKLLTDDDDRRRSLPIIVAILEEELTLTSSFKTIFSHFGGGGRGGTGQNKRISVGLFSVYSTARKTVGLNPTHFHMNFLYRAKINDFQWIFFKLFPF